MFVAFSMTKMQMKWVLFVNADNNFGIFLSLDIGLSLFLHILENDTWA